jgi:hypothetical protein
MKRFRAKDGSDEPRVADHRPRRAALSRGKEAKLSYIGNALTGNRNGLVVEAELGSATGTIEREAAMTMVVRQSPDRVD